jgi:hypothetical protein
MAKKKAGRIPTIRFATTLARGSHFRSQFFFYYYAHSTPREYPMGDVTFTHDKGRTRATVGRGAVRAQSIALGEWLGEGVHEEKAVNVANSHDHTFAMDNLTRAEFDAFVRYMRGEDLALARRVVLRAGQIFGPASSDPVLWFDGAAYEDDVVALVRPAHEYDCAILWNRIVRTVNTRPTAPLIAALDDLADVCHTMWMGDVVAAWCCRNANGTEAWSNALYAAAFKHSRRAATTTAPPGSTKNGADRAN